MRLVACLYTAADNVAIFDAACPPGLALRHTVRPDLLAEAERIGGMSDALACQTAEVLRDLAREASVVLLTCSTLGAAIGRASPASVPILRADAALAAAALLRTERLTVLYTAPTSLAPTRSLFDDGSGRLDMRLVPDAWRQFRAGELDAYHQCIAVTADAAFASGAVTVALAQASMAPAARLCRAGVPLTIPEAGLRAAMQ